MAITWLLRTAARLEGDFKRSDRTPAGSLAKAASVGANTVKFTDKSERVPAIPAVLTADTRVE